MAEQPRWRGMEVMEFIVAANNNDQKFGSQTQFDGKTIVALYWSPKLTKAPTSGANVIGTTDADAKVECFITLKKGQQEYMNKIPLTLLDPDSRQGDPYFLPEPAKIDWNNSTVKFLDAANITAGEVLVIYAYYQ